MDDVVQETVMIALRWSNDCLAERSARRTRAISLAALRAVQNLFGRPGSKRHAMLRATVPMYIDLLPPRDGDPAKIAMLREQVARLPEWVRLDARALADGYNFVEIGATRGVSKQAVQNALRRWANAHRLLGR